jgi:hypothetical protein
MKKRNKTNRTWYWVEKNFTLWPCTSKSIGVINQPWAMSQPSFTNEGLVLGALSVVPHDCIFSGCCFQWKSLSFVYYSLTSYLRLTVILTFDLIIPAWVWPDYTTDGDIVKYLVLTGIRVQKLGVYFDFKTINLTYSVTETSKERLYKPVKNDTAHWHLSLTVAGFFYTINCRLSLHFDLKYTHCEIQIYI